MNKAFSKSIAPITGNEQKSNPNKPPVIDANLVQAVMGKMVNSRVRTQTPDQMAGTIGQFMTQRTAKNISDSKNIMSVLPDLQTAKEILSSSILSPNNMLTTECSYNSTFDEIPELKNKLLAIVKKHFTTYYKLDEKLPNWLASALWDTGAQGLLVLPEGVLQASINENTYTNEAYQRAQGGVSPLGKGFVPTLLAKDGITKPVAAHQYTVENFSSAPAPDAQRFNIFNYLVTDCLEAFATDYRSKVREVPVLESYAKRYSNGSKLMEQVNFKEVKTDISQILYLKSNLHEAGSNIGHPVIIEPPTECISPVCNPSDPSKRSGVFLATDTSGNLIRDRQTPDYYSQLAGRADAWKGAGGDMTSIIRQQMEGNGMINQMDSSDAFIQANQQAIFQQIVVRDMTERLKNGEYNEEFFIDETSQIFEIMWARLISGKMTKLVYVPDSLFTYINFELNDFGVGVSLLEKTKLIASLRAMAQYANSIAMVKNAIQRRDITLEFDPEDPDPALTLEEALNAFAMSNQTAYPAGVMNPTDLLQYLSTAGITVNTSGNYRYPETKFTVTDVKNDRPPVDTGYTDDLRKTHLWALGTPPEVVEAGQGAEYAISVATTNILFAKRVYTYQLKFMPQVTDHAQKYILASGPLMDEIIQAIIDHKPAKKEKPKETADAKTGKQVPIALNDTSSTDPDPDAGGDKTSKTDKADTDAKAVDGSDKDAKTPDKDVPDSEDFKKTDDVIAKESTRKTIPFETFRLARAFVESIEVTLPSPDTTQHKIQTDLFAEYSASLDGFLAPFISDDLFDEQDMGKLDAYKKEMLGQLKAHWQREWMFKNDVFPEMQELYNAAANEDEDTTEILGVLESFNKNMSKLLGSFVKKIVAQAKANDKVVEKLQPPDGADDELDTAAAGDGTDDASLDTGAGDGADLGVDDTTGADTGADDVADTDDDSTSTSTDDETNPDDDNEPKV